MKKEHLSVRDQVRETHNTMSGGYSAPFGRSSAPFASGQPIVSLPRRVWRAFYFPLKNLWTKFSYAFFPTLIQRSVRPLLKLLTWIFLRMEVRGREHLKDIPKSAIFAANHTHELDSFLIGAGLPPFSRHIPFYFVSKPKKVYDGNGKNKFFARLYGGALFRLLGAIPADIGHKSYERALRRHVDILNSGGNICIFPEGSVQRPGKERKIRGGTAYLSHATGVPIVPVKVEGIDTTMSLKDFLLRKRKVRITFGEPQESAELFKDYSREDEGYYKRVSEKVMRTVGSL